MQLRIEEKPTAYHDGFLIARALGFLERRAEPGTMIDEGIEVFGEVRSLLCHSVEWIELFGHESDKVPPPETLERTSLLRGFLLERAQARGDTTLSKTREEVERVNSILDRAGRKEATPEEEREAKQFLADYVDPLLDALRGLVGIGGEAIDDS